LWQDLRFAVRSLMKKPGYTLVIVLTFALGIGAVSAVFSLFNAVLLRPLPYEQSERLAQLQAIESEKAGAYFSHPDLIDLRNRSQEFERMAAVRSGGWTLTGDGDAERLPGARVSAEFFPMLGVKPALGRVFWPEEDRPELIASWCCITRCGSGASAATRVLSDGRRRSTATATR
jgi:hypothetical protein